MNRELESAHCGRLHAAGSDVPASLLGREPRYSPSREFDTLHVAIELSVDFRRRRVAAACRSRVRSFQDGLSSLSFDAAGMKILSASVGGRKTAFKHEGSRLSVKLPRKLKAREEAEVVVRYSLERPAAGLSFIPSYPPASPARQVWSQGQPEDSRYWFPCHDAPHQKASSEVIATVPDGFTAVSNGRLVSTRRDARKRTTTFHWRMHRPHSLYLVTLAAGRFGVVKDRWRSVPVEFYCEKGREADAKRGLAKTVRAIEFFSKKLGVDYPYEKYAQVMVGEFPGGMENTSATTMTEACLIDARAAQDNDVDLLMAHELAHQWFGDLVTCRDWSHAWLNEGFATYFECLFNLDDRGQDEFDYELHRNQQDYFQEERDRYRRPIVSRNFKNPWVLFDRHLYQKAGAVLHMLRRELGDAPWWASLGHYLRKHAYQSVETGDLVAAIEETTGRNLRPFFDQWIHRSGCPQLKVRLRWTARERKLEVHAQQGQNVSDESPAFKLPLDIRVLGRGWTRDFKKSFDGKEHRWELALPGEPLDVEIDPDHWLLKKLDLQKPLPMWERQLRAPRAMSRILAAQALARWPGDRSVSLLEGALGREKFWGAATEMAQALGSMRTPAAFKALWKFRGHKDPKTRRAVLGALGRFKRPEASAALLLALRRDPSLNVQAEAARALGSLGDRKVLPALRRKLSEKSYWDILKGGALTGIASLRDLSSLNLFRNAAGPSNSYPARVYAVRALADFAQADDRVVPWLCDLLKDPDERVSMSVAGSLGRLEDERAVVPLETALKETKSCRLQTVVAEALSRVRAGGESASSKRPPKKNRA